MVDVGVEEAIGRIIEGMADGGVEEAIGRIIEGMADVGVEEAIGRIIEGMADGGVEEVLDRRIVCGKDYYYFEDPSTYPHKELRGDNPKTVDALRSWLLKLYLENSKADNHVCSVRELKDVNKCITLIIGNRLYALVNLLNPPPPEQKGTTSMIIGAIMTMTGMSNEPEDAKIDVKNIIFNVFGKIIFGFNDSNPKDGEISCNGLSENHLTYDRITKICRNSNWPSRGLNINSWIDLPQINVSELSPSSNEKILEILAPALIEDGLIDSSDLGIVLTKSASKT